MRPLTPPLSEIEKNLFGPSDVLVHRWVGGDPSLPREIIEALEVDADACARREAFEEAMDRDEGEELSVKVAVSEMPAHMRELIARRVAASQAHFSAKPRAGQVLCVDEIIGPQGSLGWDLPRPLAVLISEPAEKAEVWWGWMVAPETDYASEWDILLEPDDEPFDPLAGMVQFWNPVHVYIPSTSVVLAELSVERLSAARAVAAEFISGEQLMQLDIRPGFVAPRRTLGDVSVLTGSPLGGESDPRWRYQQLYQYAAEALREPARLALGIEYPGILDRLYRWLRGAADSFGQVLVPVPAVPSPLGEAAPSEVSETYEIGELVAFTLIPSEEGDALQLLVSLLGDIPLIASLSDPDGQLLQEVRLTPEERETDFFLGLDGEDVFTIVDEAGEVVFRWTPGEQL